MNPKWPSTCQKEAPVRYREEFEYKCPTCLQWLPLTLEFWRPTSGMRRCRACWNEYHRNWERANGGPNDVTRFKGRVRYQLNKERLNAANRKWKAANRERVSAYNRAYREQKKAKV